MALFTPRLVREQCTMQAMLQIYCRDKHGLPDQALCADCHHLLNYATQRLQHCPFGADKPACNRCQVHCYSASLRERVKAVMRYAGPRMLWRHPWLSLCHLLDKLRPAPTLPSKHKKARRPD